MVLWGGFVFGGKSQTITNPIFVMVVFTATGDINFGTGVIRPTFTFNPNAPPEDRIVTFSVIRDRIIEGQCHLIGATAEITLHLHEKVSRFCSRM